MAREPESAATLGARQGSPGTRPVRAPRTSPTAAMSTARSSLEDMRLFSLAPTFFAVRAGCRLPHFVLGRSGIDSLPGALPRLRRGTLPAKSQEPVLRGKALCALISSICSLFLCRSVVHYVPDTSSEGEQKGETVACVALRPQTRLLSGVASRRSMSGLDAPEGSLSALRPWRYPVSLRSLWSPQPLRLLSSTSSTPAKSLPPPARPHAGNLVGLCYFVVIVQAPE